ncbi:MAG: amino acid adenylation domain-containing protein [Crocosphaera sp.]|nr:amino acid adenylation domain-containing protein [Crocosphaera sp.]
MNSQQNMISINNYLDIFDEKDIYIFPTSSAQARLWFLTELEPESFAYNEQVLIHLKGKLNSKAIKDSFNEIINRHEILRTLFTSNNGQPVQIILPNLTLDLPLINLTELSKTEQQDTIKQISRQEIETPFKLTEVPLIKLKLLQLNPQENLLIITLHHIITDGWSGEILMKELATLYEAFSSKKSSPLEPLDIQYADFTLWQNEYLQSDTIIDKLNNWKDKLADIPPLLELSTDYSRPALPSYQGGCKTFTLSQELSHKLQQLSQNNDSTLFMTLLTAWGILLSKYSQETDIVIGSPIANRNKTEIEPLIGCFVNNLALRINLSNNPTFTELLQQVRQVCLGAYNDQDVPFEKLVEILQPQRNLSNHPIFQVMFALQTANSQTFQSSTIDFTILEKETIIAKFDLSLEIRVTKNGLSGNIEYRKDLFKASTIERIVNNFQVLLNSILLIPESPISNLSLLSELEKNKILKTWKNEQLKHPQTDCIHHLFEVQVNQTPQAVAVESEGNQLTYYQLNEKANQLAHYLQSLEVKPDSLVGLFIDRSLNMMIGLLGILKAGGAYLPLDPAYPKDRLNYLLDDAQVDVLITTKSLSHLLPATSAKIIYLDQDWSNIAAYNNSNPVSAVNRHNLAYIIYTSGSTGKPKGVMIEHQSLVNFTQSSIKQYNINSQDRILQFASISFDAAAEEIYPCLSSGATLVLRNDEMLSSVNTFLSQCNHWQLTVLDLPTAYWQQLTTEIFKKQEKLPNSIRLVIIGGEKVIPEKIRNWQKKVGDFPQLLNTYGPTEATVVSTIYSVESSETIDQEVPIGKPIENAVTYILDNELNLCPIGVPGELYIGGLGLARGYLNRPDLTAKSFIKSPFEQSQLLYKTGDLVRYLATGDIEYLGRIDNQVKLRGFRLELGEIESTLSTYPSIKDVTVIVREDDSNNKQLVAYLVGEVSYKNIGQIREYLANKLPYYMIPSGFMILEKLPLTPNGKINKKALPILESELFNQTENFIKPKTETQTIVTSIWSEILKLKRISIKSNFFELGGHSLLATQIISRIREKFNINIPLKSLFESPSIEQLSIKINDLCQGDNIPQIPTINSQKKPELIPLSFAQQRLWFLDKLEGANAVHNLPGVLEITGKLKREALTKSLQEIINRHAILRTNFDSKNGRPFQIIHPNTNLSLQVFDLRSQAETTVLEDIINQDFKKPFDLKEDNLFRVSLIQLEEEKHILLMMMHHIIFDGWSMNVLTEELTQLYESNVHQTSVKFPQLTIQYADFALWQRDNLQGEVLDHQLNYWQKKLVGIPSLLELPTDYNRPPVQSFRGSYQSFLLPKVIQDKLIEISHNNGVTLFMTLLAAWKVLLSKYSREKDIVIGSPIANRNKPEIEPLIGFFANTLALRTNLSNNPTFKELLTQVKQTCLEAYAHQDIPFEKLVDVLKPERNLSHHPIFQIMFVLQNTDKGVWELPGITFNSLERKDVITSEKETIAKFDLTLMMKETKQGLIGEIEYRQDLFTPSTIKKMVKHFEILLQEILKKIDQKIGEVSILTGAEKKQLIIDWNQTKVDYPDNKCLHQLFEEQVNKTPNAVALIEGNNCLTYQQLNQKANQLAHYLKKLDVEAETLVGVCVERSLKMVIGLLGILKAGGAYVPIDANYPQKRIDYLLNDAKIAFLLTEEKLKDKFLTDVNHLILLDRDWKTIEQESNSNFPLKINAKNLAYIIYTSGSTGNPKGVMIEHKALINYLYWCIQYYQVAQGNGSSVQSSIGFDATITSLYSPLLTGKTVTLLPEKDEIEELNHYLRSHNSSLVKITPAHLDILNHSISSEEASDKSNVFVIGGEALFAKQIEFWQQHSPDTRLVNEYGPTETVVGCCIYEINPHKPLSQAVPIGRPIANTQLYILDDYQQLVPQGVIGELYIGGEGLARGYLHKESLTTQKFIRNPFDTNRETRLYKTGDLCRYLDDGTIEYIGRIDNQVKIRGFRIELGEIESVLKEHSDVKEVAVIVTEEEQKAKQLVAYITANISHNNLSEILKSYLKDKLPDYMIPNLFILLEKMPLTPNGKINYQGLPSSEHYFTNKPIIPPRNPVEETLGNIWKEILNLETVSMNHNFFELGGDSIVSIQVVSQAKQAGIQITAKQLFEYQTIGELATVAQTQTSVIAEQGLIIGKVELLPIQTWFFEQDFAEPNHWNQSILLTVEPEINHELLRESFQQLLHHHDGLRLTFENINNNWQQTYELYNVMFPLEIIDLSKMKLSEQTQLITTKANEVQQSFNLSQSPLIKAILFQLGNNQPSRLLIVIHHLVVDGVSWRILLEDLVSVYQQLSQNKEIQLPRKTTSLKKWSEQLQTYAQSDKIKEELDYWLTLSQQKINPLPLDYSVSFQENTVDSTQLLKVSLNKSDNQALLTDVATAYQTQINDVLLTALVKAFYQWTGQSSLLINLEGHGREELFDQLDISRTVGWFTTLFPVLLTLDQTNDLGDHLTSIKEQLRKIPNKGINYGILRYLSNNETIKQQLNMINKPQISFNYLGQFDQTIKKPPLLNIAPESSGINFSPKAHNSHLIEINAVLISDQLEITWSYSTNLYKADTIQTLADNYVEALQELIKHCQSIDEVNYTPSDFPEANLSQEDLDSLFLELE